MKKMMSRLGFTLIELLIVITIIGILAVVFLPTVLNAPAKARDATRRADLSNIVEGIEAARLDGMTMIADSGCAGTKLSTMATFFGGGFIPSDPNSKNAIMDKSSCNLVTDTGKYSYEYYGGDSPKRYGIFARVENSTGNIACASIKIGGPLVVSPTLTGVNNLDCYAVFSQ